MRKEARQRLEAEEGREKHKGVRTTGWRACARLQAVRARLESDDESGSDSRSGSDSESEPSEYDSDDDRALGELLQRDEGRREGKVRERGRAAARTKVIREAEAEEAARRAASEPRRTRGGAKF